MDEITKWDKERILKCWKCEIKFRVADCLKVLISVLNLEGHSMPVWKWGVIPWSCIQLYCNSMGGAETCWDVQTKISGSLRISTKSSILALYSLMDSTLSSSVCDNCLFQLIIYFAFVIVSSAFISVYTSPDALLLFMTILCCHHRDLLFNSFHSITPLCFCLLCSSFLPVEMKGLWP